MKGEYRLTDKILQMIGLAKKAGKALSGQYQVEESIKKYEACLIVCACDASENTKKRLTDMCRYRNIPVCFYGTKQEIGKFTGKDERSAAAVTDSGFAERIEMLIREVKA